MKYGDGIAWTMIEMHGGTREPTAGEHRAIIKQCVAAWNEQEKELGEAAGSNTNPLSNRHSC